MTVLANADLSGMQVRLDQMASGADAREDVGIDASTQHKLASLESVLSSSELPAGPTVPSTIPKPQKLGADFRQDPDHAPPAPPAPPKVEHSHKKLK